MRSITTANLPNAGYNIGRPLRPSIRHHRRSYVTRMRWASLCNDLITRIEWNHGRPSERQQEEQNYRLRYKIVKSNVETNRYSLLANKSVHKRVEKSDFNVSRSCNNRTNDVGKKDGRRSLLRFSVLNVIIMSSCSSFPLQRAHFSSSESTSLLMSASAATSLRVPSRLSVSLPQSGRQALIRSTPISDPACQSAMMMIRRMARQIKERREGQDNFDLRGRRDESSFINDMQTMAMQLKDTLRLCSKPEDRGNTLVDTNSTNDDSNRLNYNYSEIVALQRSFDTIDNLMSNLQAGSTRDTVNESILNAEEAIADLSIAHTPSLPYLLPRKLSSKFPICTGRVEVLLTLQVSPPLNNVMLSSNERQVQYTEDETSYVSQSSTLEADRVDIVITVDGFSAPLTAGSFLNNMVDGRYEGITLRKYDSSNSIVAKAKEQDQQQASLSDGKDAPIKSTASYNSIPLESFVSGDLAPRYSEPIDVQEGELPILPLSVYGAVAMTHPAVDNASLSSSYSSSSDFFIYLHDKSTAGLGGLSFDEGNFAVFGYVTSDWQKLNQINVRHNNMTKKCHLSLE